MGNDQKVYTLVGCGLQIVLWAFKKPNLRGNVSDHYSQYPEGNNKFNENNNSINTEDFSLSLSFCPHYSGSSHCEIHCIVPLIPPLPTATITNLWDCFQLFLTFFFFKASFSAGWWYEAWAQINSKVISQRTKTVWTI